jgi:serum/glucocorticoid-regulated kinase 2
VNKNYFEFEYIIGRGGFSKVWKVKLKKNGKNYALKEMFKVKIIDKKSEKNVIGERDLLSKLKHPFIINIICAFQDYENLYLLLDYLSGGDLRYHFNLTNKFNENDIKFFISNIILSLEYIHSNDIIHRDLKPENLVFDNKGYLCLTDFGIAKVSKNKSISDTSGTPGYMAPEAIHGKNQSFSVDFFAVGVIGYELLIGHRPYRGKNRKEIKKLMDLKEKEILIEEDDNKNNLYSNDCINFFNSCLKKEVEKRLGFHNGIKELKSHIWFKNFDWRKLYNKEIKPNFLPKDEKNFDQKYCNENDKISNDTIERYKGYMKKDNFVKIFEGYTFFNNDATTTTVENEAITRSSTTTKSNNFKDNINKNKNFILNINKHNNNNYNENKKDMSKLLLEKKIFDNIHDKEKSLFNDYMKDKKIKKKLEKQQESHDIININKKYLKNEINEHKIAEESKADIKSIVKEQNKRSDLINDDKNIFFNDIKNCKKEEYFPIKIFNNINILKDKNTANDNIQTDLKNIQFEQFSNYTNEVNIFNIKKNNNSSINLIENKNINIPRINFSKSNKKKLNIHNLSSRDFNLKEKQEYINDFKKENEKDVNMNKNNNILLNSYILNKNKRNKSPRNGCILPDIRHFNFIITNQKKIRHMYLNQNRIIENNINSLNQENRPKILDKFIVCKHPLNKNNMREKILGETYLTFEKNLNLKGKMIKSQSSVFPIINNL